MSDMDNYRAQLKAKVDALEAEQDMQTKLRDRSKDPHLDHPNEQFIDDNIGEHKPKSEQEIKWEAWTDLEKERAVDMDARVEQATLDTFSAEVQEQEVRRRDDDKQKEIQRNKEVEDTKTRQNEAELERKRYSREEAEAEQSEAQRQAIVKDHAEKERQKAEVRLKDRQQDEELERNRELFRQAASRTQGLERDIE